MEQAVPETDAQGRPTLWYANIYLQDQGELEALDILLIHHSSNDGNQACDPWPLLGRAQLRVGSPTGPYSEH
jgi:hypothetical protein